MSNIRFSQIKSYLNNNLKPSLTKVPCVFDLKILVPFIVFSVFSFSYGSYHGLFSYGLIDSKLMLILPITLFIFPSFLEELVFRGLLIPINAKKSGIASIVLFIGISTLLFVSWHPLNALTINTGAQGFFLNPHFLIIVALMGITCSYTYIQSKSLWVPVFIHWITVVVWVFMLGGRNLIIE